MDGVLVIDKPPGLTSHDVVAIARRALREKRIGHTGTLDPLATGVLPLACGRATRLVRFLIASDKDYEATVQFGLATDTYDVTGTRTITSEARPTRDSIEEALGRLRGDYLQTPPAFSAKKVAGTRAYELAREARPVELTPVPVHVAHASLTTYDGQHGTFAITCSAGFYVRTFAHDLGALTGGAACLTALRRTRSGDFSLSAAATIPELQAGDAQGRLIPVDQLLPRFPATHLTPEGLNRVSHGREIDGRHVESGGWSPGMATWLRLIGPDGRLIALAEPVDDGAVLHPSVVLI